MKPHYQTELGKAYCADSLELLPTLAPGSVDLVLTSPPYALHFKKEYGNADQDQYVDWFMPFAKEISRVLKPDGSFVLNIGGSWTPGVPVRSLYHFRLLLALCDDPGFNLCQEFFWYNPAKMPAARRLVEAGVRCVTLSYSFWDFHGQNFAGARGDLPLLDQATSALVEDLHQRGLDKDVSVVVWGEFGRTPKINAAAGRDHWPNVSCALLAGGGMRTGQVIGATDRTAAEAKDRPVRFEEVFATLYNRLGIDAGSTTVNDLSGRPQYLADHHPPIHELI